MTKNASDIEPADPFKPYKGRFVSHDVIPAKGRNKNDILEELATMAQEENAKWETGQVSGTFYHAGEAHRAFLNKVFELFSHENTIQFDLCPSMFKMESEIISMTAKMLNADAVRTNNPQDQVCGTVTSGGTESIFDAQRCHGRRHFKKASNSNCSFSLDVRFGSLTDILGYRIDVRF